MQREKRRFLVYMATSAYHVISKGVENGVFRHTCMYKRPILTKYWNYNNFVEILCSYLRYTDRLLDKKVLWKYYYRKKYIEEFV